MRSASQSIRVSVTIAMALLIATTTPVGIVGVAAPPHLTEWDDNPLNDVVIEDYSDMITIVDIGTNDLNGNMGTIEKNPGATECTMSLEQSGSASYHMNLAYDFTSDDDTYSFCGMFCSLCGLTDALTTFDGETIESQAFREHTLNFEDLDGDVNAGSTTRVTDISLSVRNTGQDEIKLKVELKDARPDGEAPGVRYRHFRLQPSTEAQTFQFSFRDPDDYRIGFDSDLDLSRVKLFNLIIERQNDWQEVYNPDTGVLQLHRIWLNVDQDYTRPTDAEALLDLQERMAYQYFNDWSSRKEASLWIPQDRSNYNDLLSVGAVGFALPAHVIAAERGWIRRGQAAERVLSILRILDNEAAYGYEAVGRIGYRGWLYHFLGTDGFRKQNYDYTDTPENEAANTVELSSIDTGLAVMGALVAQSYFTDTIATETEIRDRAQSFYDRVDWSFMLDPGSQQFYLGWKPSDRYPDSGFSFRRTTVGGYSGMCDWQQTLDYYTDEALILALLAMGSVEEPLSPAVYYSLALEHKNGVYATWPGSLFTYQFLGCFMDTRNLGTRPGDQPATWYDNSRSATLVAMAHAEANADGYAAYGRNGWGLSAADGPWNAYHAYGAPSIAHTDAHEEDGTITYYGMLSAAQYGPELMARATEALSRAWDLGHWHNLSGLPDAYNADVSQALPPDPPTDPLDSDPVLRRTGSWHQRATFGIDQGPMLLAIENARSGLINHLVTNNPNMKRAMDRLDPASATIPAADPPYRLLVEAENGLGDGLVTGRPSASGGQTVRLADGDARTLTVDVPMSMSFMIRARYSNANDDASPTESVSMTLDGLPLGYFEAQDTGSGEDGWLVLVPTHRLGTKRLQAGQHTFGIRVSDGDGAGLELDTLLLDAVHCNAAYLPVLDK